MAQTNKQHFGLIAKHSFTKFRLNNFEDQRIHNSNTCSPTLF